MAFQDHGGCALVRIGPGDSTLSNVNASSSNVTLLSANASRIRVILVNDSSATLYLKYGATASTTSYSYKILGSQVWEMPDPVYKGQIDGIWDSATGAARITELT